MPILQTGKLRLGKVTSCPGSGPSLSTPSVQPSLPLPTLLTPTHLFILSFYVSLRDTPPHHCRQESRSGTNSPCKSSVMCGGKEAGKDLFILFIITSSMH